MICSCLGRWLLLVSFSLVALGMAGCSLQTATAVVSGTIKVKGQEPKLKGLQVVFMAPDGTMTSASVEEDGKYRATAVPAGEAKVAFVYTAPWWSANNEQQGGKRRLVRPDKGNEKPPASAQHDPIPVALREPATSGIKTRIESGKDNVFDYDIK